MINAHITRNGIELHVMDCEAIESHFGRDTALVLRDYKFYHIPDTDMYITTHINSGDMAQFVLGESASFDYALPRSFWNSCEDWRDHVWLYETGDYFGKPFNLVAAFNTLLLDHHFIAQ